MKPLVPVMVVWLDASMSDTAHWQEGRKPAKPRAKDHLCTSVGMLTYIDSEFVQIIQTTTNGQHAAEANIPRGMVRALYVLNPVEANS